MGDFQSGQLVADQVFIFPVSSDFLLALATPHAPINSTLMAVGTLSTKTTTISGPRPVPTKRSVEAGSGLSFARLAD